MGKCHFYLKMNRIESTLKFYSLTFCRPLLLNIIYLSISFNVINSSIKYKTNYKSRPSIDLQAWIYLLHCNLIDIILIIYRLRERQTESNHSLVTYVLRLKTSKHHHLSSLFCIDIASNFLITIIFGAFHENMTIVYHAI